MLGIEYSKAFDAGRAGLRESFKKHEPTGYEDLLVRAIYAVNKHYPGSDLDPDRIVRVNFGDYQGTLVFVVGGAGYQPHTHYAASVSYGSCSHCDAFDSVADGYSRWDSDGNECGPDDEAIDGYERLALHLFQSLKPIN